MTVSELIEYLKTLPQDIQVCYTDADFGHCEWIVTDGDIYVIEEHLENVTNKYLKIGKICYCRNLD